MTGTKIKICGLLRLCEAEYINSAFPDYVGFVFFDKSRRNIAPEKAKDIRSAIDPLIKTVGVFVDESRERIAEMYREGLFSVVQLHGSEDDEYIAELRDILPKAVIWKAYGIKTEKDIESAAESSADMVMLDNGCGTGKSFDWSLIDWFTKPFILAGGLTPDNIPEAVRRLRPYAVDLSSGVESGGVKDRHKILAAVAALKGN